MIDVKNFIAVLPAHNLLIQPKLLGRDRVFSRLKILLTLYFLACVAFFVVRTAHWKQVNDPAQLHYLCFLMDHGMAPYRDVGVSRS
jgi:hypothetical protein